MKNKNLYNWSSYSEVKSDAFYGLPKATSDGAYHGDKKCA